MLLEHERDSALGVGSVVTSETMLWAWMLWLSDALGTRTRFWLGHGRCGKPCAKGVDVVTAQNAMRGGSSHHEASEGPEMLFVPRRPVLMGSGGKACFAR